MTTGNFDHHGYSEVLFHKNNSAVRTLTLNRPRQLNALSFDMLSRLHELFVAYEHDSNVKLVIIKGKGKAFSSGGDVAHAARHLYSGNWRAGLKCFETAYTLMYVIAANKTPQVSILNGMVMGAGAGLSILGSFRVATENTVFAMPETALGGFPDVGSSYFLSRLPGFCGEYLGLTGARLDGPEMLALGFATHYVPSSKLSSLEEALVCKVGDSTDSSSIDDSALISAILDEFSEHPSLKEKSVCHQMDVIDKYFCQTTVDGILCSLEKELATINCHHPEWLSSSVQSLKKASPTSLKITLKSIREGRLQECGACIVREYRIAYHVLRGEISKDFMEGCRAILLDKDKNPKWKPCKLEAVTEQMVAYYFSKLEDVDELKVPERSNVRNVIVSSKL